MVFTFAKVAIKSVKENRKADIPLYISDNDAVKKKMRWTPKKSAQEIITDTFEWIRANESLIKKTLL